MILQPIKRRLLASTVFVSAVVAATPVLAQVSPAPADQQPSSIAPATSPTMSVANGGEIVVTGSRLSTPNMQSESPVTSVSAQEIKATGTSNIENLVAALPQGFIDQSSGVANGASGTATANLRNLGSDRTLVLVDGHRLAPGDPSGGGSAADLNNIPSFLVKRIDVLTGGASATYGADAVAGVVNFILDDTLEGFKIDVQGNINQHDNTSGIARTAITTDPRYNAKTNGITDPGGSAIDGGTVDVGAAFGSKFADDRGHITIYGGYHHQQAVLQNARDFSSCPLDSEGIEGGSATSRATNFFCSGSSNTAITNFLPNSGTGSRIIVTSGTGGAGGTAGTRAYDSTTDGYNYNPTNYLQRPDTRYTAGAFATYEINDHFKPYGSFQFMDDHSLAQIAASGTFNNLFTINCSNPLASTAQLTTLGCTAPGAGSTQTVTTAIGKRNVEGGGRIDDLRHTDYSFNAGMKGDLFPGFSYDAHGQYGTTIYNEHYLADFSRTKVQNALNACLNPNGTAISDANCSPYNIFTGTTTVQPTSADGVTQAALDYVETPGFKSGYTREVVVSGQIQGDLGTYGIQSPFAHNGVSIVFGPEYRRESLNLDTDTEFATGDLLGQGGETKSTSGRYSVTEGFVEARVPLVQDVPGFQDLTFDGGYRYSHYTTVGHTNTYKLGVDWSPFTGDEEGLVRFRGSYNRAVRAPTIQDFYAPSQLGLGGSADPCSSKGKAASASLATCLQSAQGDPNFAAQYGNGLGIAGNPASQYNSITSGAATAGTPLGPETAITKTIGAVFEPKHLLPGFSASVDYYNINLKHAITRDGFDTILNECLNTGNAYYCSLIHRDPSNGSLWLTPNGYINDPIYNGGHVKTSGIDFTASYNMDLNKYGHVALTFTGSYLLHQKQDVELHNADGTLEKLGSAECKGYYGDFCGVPNPTFRSRTRLTYSPNDHVSISGLWRYYGPTNSEYASTQVGSDGNTLIPFAGYGKDALKYDKIKAYSYFDLSATVTTTEHLQLRAGVNNLMDKNPPLIAGVEYGAGANNGNTYPNYYDDLGREFYIGATMNF